MTANPMIALWPNGTAASAFDGIPADPCEVAHDAALIIDRDGSDEYAARLAVVVAAGYVDLAQWADDVVLHWRACITSAMPSTDAGRQAVNDALDILAINGRLLARLGWGAVDLFGCDLNGNRHGLAMILNGSTVLDVQGAFITYRRTGEATARTYWRGSVSSDALPFFELNTKGGSHGGR